MTCRCRSGECDPECDGPALRAEIERLTERLETNAATLRNREDVNCRLLTENDRLRALSQNNAKSWDAIVRERDALRAAMREAQRLLNEATHFLEQARAKSVRNENEEKFPGDNQ